MDKGYIYIVSDGVGDVFKFGFTIDPLSRLCKYNATECLRPMRYELVAEYSTERESRDVEILIKNELKSHLYNSVVKPEVSLLYNRIFEMSTTPSKLDYEGIVKSITETAKISGIKEGVIRESIIDLAVGYKFEDAPQRVIFEKRRKKLVNVDGLDIYYDTKPKLIERLQRLALLDYKLKTNYFSN
jgi:hypothetical protein